MTATEADVPAQNDRRFGGLARLYGVAGAAAVQRAHVAVVGVGGVGSWAAEALARSGVGYLTLIDLDHVAESNINRQIHANTLTLGQAKVLAMRDRIALIHPGCKVAAVDAFVDAENWPSLLNEAEMPVCDAVIDACDDSRAKVVLAQWARGSACRFITVGAAGGKRHAHLVDIADLSATTHDPLLAQLRYRLRREYQAPRQGKSFGIACVFSREAVASPGAGGASASDGSLNCSGYGSVVCVTATFGQSAAGWVLDRIASGAERLTL